MFSIKGILTVLFSAAMMLTGGNADAPPAADGVSHVSVQQLDAIAEHATPYVGDASSVGAILDLLPVMDSQRDKTFFELQTDTQPYGLTVYYMLSEKGRYGFESNPFKDCDSQNNAAILFAYIGNLDSVTFCISNEYDADPYDASLYTPNALYTREQLEQTFGDLAELGKDTRAFQKALSGNMRITNVRAYYGRIHIGEDDLGYIYMRCGAEPDEIIQNGDGSYIMIYKNLGAGMSYPERGEPVVIPGVDVSFFMDYPAGATYGNDISGVCRIGVRGSFTDTTEILWTLGIEEGTYAGITGKLGKPAVERVNLAGVTRLEYAFGVDGQYIYFDIKDGVMIEHGVTAMSW